MKITHHSITKRYPHSSIQIKSQSSNIYLPCCHLDGYQKGARYDIRPFGYIHQYELKWLQIFVILELKLFEVSKYYYSMAVLSLGPISHSHLSPEFSQCSIRNLLFLETVFTQFPAHSAMSINALWETIQSVSHLFILVKGLCLSIRNANRK